MNELLTIEAPTTRISRQTWIAAGAGIAAGVASLLFSHGPWISGAISKTEHVNMHAPFGYAVASVCVGSALSIWIGRLPRSSVAPWSAVLAAIFTTVALAAAAGEILLFGTARVAADPLSWSLFFAAVSFPTMWIAQVPLGLLAASVQSPTR